MNTLEEKFKPLVNCIDDGMSNMTSIYYDIDTVNENAKSCTTIAIEFAKGFAEWLPRNIVTAEDGYYFLHLKDLEEISVEKLMETYLQTLK